MVRGEDCAQHVSNPVCYAHVQSAPCATFGTALLPSSRSGTWCPQSINVALHAAASTIIYLALKDTTAAPRISFFAHALGTREARTILVSRANIGGGCGSRCCTSGERWGESSCGSRWFVNWCRIWAEEGRQ
jgi:hypothetical protein